MSDRDLVENAADERQVTRAAQEERARVRRRRSLMRQQLSTPDGREFVWNQLQDAGIFEDCSGPVEVVYAFLGRRRAGLKLLIEVMQSHSKEYLLMQGEAIARDKREREGNAAARTSAAAATE